MRWQQRQNNFRTPKNHRLPRANLFGSLFSFGSRIDGEFVHSYLHHIIAAGMDSKQHLRREKDKALPTVRPYLSNCMRCTGNWTKTMRRCMVWMYLRSTAQKNARDAQQQKTVILWRHLNDVYFLILCDVLCCVKARLKYWIPDISFKSGKHKLPCSAHVLLDDKLQSNRRIQQ